MATIIAVCVDKVTGMAPAARNNLAELLDPNRKVTNVELQGIYSVEKAIEIVASGEKQENVDSVKELLSLVEA